MTTEEDLRAVIVTAAVHVRPGGVAVLMPDTTRELFAPDTRHGGHDGEDGRSLRYLEWVRDPDPDDSTYDVEFVVVVQEPGEPVRIEHERHVFGVLSGSTWRGLITAAGLELLDSAVEDLHAGEHEVFATRCL